MSDTLYGLLAAGGAIIAFGCYGVPVKGAGVQRAGVSPMVLQLYAGAATAATSLCGLAGGPAVLSWWGTAGAALWMASQPFAFAAIRLIGLSLAPAIWAATTIAVSFLWGYLLFDEPVRSLPFSLLAILLLTLGILGVTLSATSWPHRLLSSRNYRPLVPLSLLPPFSLSSYTLLASNRLRRKPHPRKNLVSKARKPPWQGEKAPPLPPLRFGPSCLG